MFMYFWFSEALASVQRAEGLTILDGLTYKAARRDGKTSVLAIETCPVRSPPVTREV